ncbi:MAG: hypothetical protein ACI4P7_03250 [Bacilli bacterium]
MGSSTAFFTALESAVEQNDEELIKKCAHKVKKTGEKLGLTDLVKYAAILEDAKSGKISTSFEVLKNEYNKIFSLLNYRYSNLELSSYVCWICFWILFYLIYYGGDLCIRI